uniref:hypothetical protein n=1 Tax=Nocardia suismassiliense TaxID=2077092 RepID=UPI003F493D63
MTSDWLTDLRNTPALAGIAGATAALIVAFISGWFTARTSHKLPHERLHWLVQITKDIPNDVDRGGVVRAQMVSELRKLREYSPPERASLSVVWACNGVIAVLILLAFNSIVSWWIPMAAVGVGAAVFIYMWATN